MIQKNRNREKFSFANINLLGLCNADCKFCLGKDISQLLEKHNQINVPYIYWRNFENFLELCRENEINKLYITGQNTDALLYKYISELIDFLHKEGFTVGIRTNGYRALNYIDICNKCTNSVGYSIHSLNPKTNYKIIGRMSIPDWDQILTKTNNSRVAIVICKENVDEFYDIVKFISNYQNVKYIQVRRISTDTRYEQFRHDIEIYEKLYENVKNKYEQIGEFYLAQQFSIFGKQVNFWRTVETSINSINYFTDGTISDEYFVVEGYLKNYEEN